MERSAAWPTAESASDIHRRLCEGDPVASSSLAEAYLDPLAAWVARVNPRIDPHLCDQAAEDAIIALSKNPLSYNPAKSPLDAYLRMSASGDLKNLLERERRRSARETSLADVELVPSGRNLVQAENDPAEIIEREESERSRDEQWTSLVALDTFTPQEQAVLALLRQGERATEAYARVLGIAHLAPAEQQREVKRVKDRVKRRLQRARGKP